MGNKLLIRAYNVGCGDCIYVRIPEGRDGFHILIDCGRKGAADLLKDAVRNLAETMLPKDPGTGRKRLDLIVATHRHEDHIKGFDGEWFDDIDVRNVWLSVAMDPAHPQAKGVRAVHQLAANAMRSLMAEGQALSPELEPLAALYRVSNDEADRLLMEELPRKNRITPRFVYSGQTGAELGVAPKHTTIRILAPERDVDGYYLGESMDASLRGFQAQGATFGAGVAAAGAPGNDLPRNISPADFRLLRSRMLSNALGFAAKDTSIQNNLSVVLQIEWKKRRLLFVGDAEWDGEYREGKQNGSWNVMWEKHRNGPLKAPVDFLKIGHHGSINATPPPPSAGRPGGVAAGSVYEILDTLLPLPKAGKKPTAQAVVSTEREFYVPIPEGKLLVEIARRVTSTRNYDQAIRAKGRDPASIWVTEKARKNRFYETYEKPFLDQPQPLRTDLEALVDGRKFIDIELAPGR